MLTPRRVLAALRIAFVVGSVGLMVLLLGPFQGLEHVFGLTDKPAHAIASFAVAQALFAIAPRWRRTDLAMIMLVFAIATELAQGLTGRSMSISDFGADALGIGVALIPGMIEQLRRLVRKFPDASFASIAKGDRRKNRPRRLRSSASTAGQSGRLRRARS